MVNWEHVRVDERELKEFLDFNVPIRLPASIPYNAGVTLVGETRSCFAVNRPNIGAVKLTRNNPIKGMKPENRDLHLLYDHLQNPDLPIVMVDGLFGTGKTSTVMAHAVQNLYDRGFKIVLSKPHIPVGRTYGHLPGDMNDKTDLEFTSFYQYIERFSQYNIPALKASGQIEIAPIEYIRGRDYPNAWVVVDEAQNLSPNEAVTIASRVAKGSKLILLGDTSPWQKDTKHAIDGFTYLLRLLEGDGLVGYVELKTEQHILRGKVAKALARNLMKGSIPS